METKLLVEIALFLLAGIALSSFTTAGVHLICDVNPPRVRLLAIAGISLLAFAYLFPGLPA